MTNDDLEITDDILNSKEKALSRSINEVTITLITIVNLLRQQPGFDEKKFLEDVQTLLNEATETNNHTKLVLSYFIDNSQLEDKAT